MKKILFLVGFFNSIALFSQHIDSVSQLKTQEYAISDNTTLIYQKPRISDLYRKIPKNFVGVGTEIVSKRMYGYSLAALGSTIALVPADPWLIRESRKLGEKVGFSENHSYSNLGPLKIIPGDVGSFVYFMGNGTTFILIGTGLATYGLITNDYRAQSTSMQLGVMSFEMMQSKVHWISDYPIAILLGYLIGKNIAKNARTKKTNGNETFRQKKYKMNIAASNLYGTQVVGMSIDF